MSERRLVRIRRAVLAIAAALALAACGSIPQSGPVSAGVAATDTWSNVDGQFLPGGPTKGADPIGVVEGFIGAATSPASEWAVAHQFLHPQFKDRWKPEQAVTVDESPGSRVFRIREVGTEWPSEDEPASGTPALNPSAEYEVEVQLAQVGSVDEHGVYSAVEGPALQSYRVRQDAEGQWRISEAPEGVVIDEVTFNLVYTAHQLYFYDRTWAHLVPDVRWYPTDASDATRITDALMAGQPAGWMLGSVRTAFGPNSILASRPVEVDGGEATVELAPTARAMSSLELDRMRTQLEASLTALQISRVRFTINGQDLGAGEYPVTPIASDGRLVGLTEKGFGVVSGGNVEAIAGVSDTVNALGEDLAAIDVSLSGQRAVVLLQSGEAQSISTNIALPLDSRPGLLAPSLDASGYVWTVPGNHPGEVQVRSYTGEQVLDVDAFADARAIRSLQISPDATKLAAVVTTTVGEATIEQLVVASILRDESGLPTSVGVPQVLADINGESIDMVWSGPLAIIVLKREGEQLRLLEQLIGAPGSIISAPAGAVALQDTGAPVVFEPGVSTGVSVRVLTETGSVLTKRGSSWHSPESGILLFARHSSGN